MNIFNSVFSGSRQVSINGKTYEEKNVCIQNNKVFVDGIEQNDGRLVGHITINISGHAEIIESSDVYASIAGRTFYCQNGATFNKQTFEQSRKNEQANQ